MSKIVVSFRGPNWKRHSRIGVEVNLPRIELMANDY